ncbi:hypothetical protein HGP28_16255 [Vibrio sp. SM6]|uniref:BIG2 domain-containing protein n=1 Tax=Vibrio agarilyticus TaxID=2726741 RepID=A0A7X8TUC1_9VIBR|nr:Ig-like domain-containing protein [Vibrio agarilyticus]NLS14428.1 hypothetical protein [Vibrio agarilyticus]
MFKHIALYLFVLLSLVACDRSHSPSNAIVDIVITSDAKDPVAVGDIVSFVAMSVDRGGNQMDVTDSVQWQTDNNALVINQSGTAVAEQVIDSVSVSAILDGALSNTITVKIVEPSVEALTIIPKRTQLPQGGLAEFSVVATYTNLTSSDVTKTAAVSLDNANAIILDAGILQGVTAGTVTLSADFNGVKSSPLSLLINDVTLAKVVIHPSEKQMLPVNGSLELSAYSVFSDNSAENMTQYAAWRSNTANVTVEQGIVRGISPGNASIEASYFNQTSAAVDVETVNDIGALTQLTLVNDLQQSSTELIVGGSSQIYAVGTYASGAIRDLTSIVQWNSSDEAVASVEQGIVTANGVGSTTIQGALDGIESSTIDITVVPVSLTEIRLDPSNPETLVRGTQNQVRAFGILSDGSSVDVSDKVQWISSEPNVVIVSLGTIQALQAGVSILKAQLAGIVSDELTVAVTDATASSLSVVNASSDNQFAINDRGKFQALVNYSDGTTLDVTSQVAWSSSDPTVAVVLDGVLFATSAGTTSISATFDGVSSNALSITISGATLSSLQLTSSAGNSVPLGEQLTLSVEALYSDGTSAIVTDNVSWTVLPTSTLSIVNGVVTPLMTGDATVTATLEGVTSNAQILSVTDATLESIQINATGGLYAVTLPQQFTVLFSAQGNYSDGSVVDITSRVRWMTDNDDVLLLNNAAVGINQGVANITATLDGTNSNSVPVTVIEPTIVNLQIDNTGESVPVGASLSLSAYGRYLDNSQVNLTNSVEWQSSDPSVAIVDNGKVTALTQGDTTITAKTGNLTSQVAITVTDATLTQIQIATSDTALVSALPIGVGVTLTATGYYSDGQSQDLTSQVSWSSSDTSVLSVVSGQVVAVALGSGEIGANFAGVSATPLTVTTVTEQLLSLQIVREDGATQSSAIASGTNVTLYAVGVYSNGAILDLTSQVSWRSSAVNIASVLSGVVTGLSVGSAAITASFDSVTSADFAIEVQSPTLTQIQISAPDGLTVVAGESVTLQASAFYSDGTTAEITDQVLWLTSDAQSAFVVQGQVYGLAVGEAQISAQFGERTSNTLTVSVTDATLESVSVFNLANSSEFPLTTNSRFLALANYSDGTTLDVTSQVAWSSSDPAVAVVLDGVLFATSAGTTSISATFDGVSSNALSITISSATLSSLQLTSSAGNSVPLGEQLTLSVEALYSDGTSATVTDNVSWTVLPTSTLSIVNGVVTPLMTGDATVTATLEGVTSNAQILSVTDATLESIQINATGGLYAVTLPQQFTVLFSAQGNYSDGSVVDITSRVRWMADNDDVLLLNNAAVGINQGVANITATLDGTNSNSVPVTVIEPTIVNLQIDNTGESVPVGASLSLSAYGRYLDNSQINLTNSVEWQSSDPSVAIVDNGKVTALTQGDTTITAKTGNLTSQVAITVTDATLTQIQIATSDTALVSALPIGVGVTLTATGYYSDGQSQDLTSQVSWSSSDTSVLSVVSGQVVAVALGSGEIGANFAGVSATPLTVTTVTEQLLSLQIVREDGATQSSTIASGTNVTLYAVGVYSNGAILDLTSQVSWRSSAVSIASVLSGVVTGLSVGSAAITASFDSVTSADFAIEVQSPTLTQIQISAPDGLTVVAGESVTLQASAFYSDGTTAEISDQVLWLTSDAQSAFVVQGQVYGLAEGEAQISAQFGERASNTLTVSVTEATLTAIQISALDVSGLPVGTTRALTATGFYSDASTQDLTSRVNWQSSNTAIATVVGGVVSGAAVGEASISAQFDDVTSSLFSVTVSEAQLTQLQLVAVAPEALAGLPMGGSTELKVFATYSDGAVNDITRDVFWRSSAPTIAGVVSGVAIGFSTGNAGVSASFNGSESNVLTVTVTEAVLSSIEITTQESTTLPVGTQSSLMAVGNYTDSTTQTLTDTVNWQSSFSTVATINDGILSASAEGSTTITATLNGVRSNELEYEVVLASATQLTIELPEDITAASLPKGRQLQLRVTANYSNGVQSDVSARSQWQSSDPSIATVVAGTVVAIGEGVASITANFAGISVSQTVTVTEAALESLSITPTETVTMPAGITTPMTAIGQYSDGSQVDLTTQVVWLSSNPFVARVFEGNVYAATRGQSSITAVLDSVTSNARTVDVVDGTIRSIRVRPAEFPATSNLLVGEELQLEATLFYTDGSSIDITNLDVWIVDNPSVISVTKGLVVALSPGFTFLYVDVNGFLSGDTFIDVE